MRCKDTENMLAMAFWVVAGIGHGLKADAVGLPVRKRRE